MSEQSANNDNIKITKPRISEFNEDKKVYGVIYGSKKYDDGSVFSLRKTFSVLKYGTKVDALSAAIDFAKPFENIENIKVEDYIRPNEPQFNDVRQGYVVYYERTNKIFSIHKYGNKEAALLASIEFKKSITNP